MFEGGEGGTQGEEEDEEGEELCFPGADGGEAHEGEVGVGGEDVGVLELLHYCGG